MIQKPQHYKFILNKYEILGSVKSKPKSCRCSWCGFVLVVFRGFAEELVGGCPNNPDAAIREKVSKKAMVVTGSLNQPALLTSSRATLSRKSSTCESTCNPQRC